MIYVPRLILEETAEHLRHCGRGIHECQVVWVGAWARPHRVERVVHPRHKAHGGGFQVDDSWLTRFWYELSARGEGVRVQVHTHPAEAFHSFTDDEFPMVHTPGFLSLVIPDFGAALPCLERAYLAELQNDGRWSEAKLSSKINVEA